ncbi:hypothetical protein GDO81_021905 [Engystomops pustulosus]|uniref:Uncharacterized protein n=1 Tax=Engystomops pustulosus TaxID=76066 RepID=A0AAV6ZPA2_ENGPU|nr:hypothetical protein GDO81_021905 [Engystomops pustulosus]
MVHCAHWRFFDIRTLSRCATKQNNKRSHWFFWALLMLDSGTEQPKSKRWSEMTRIVRSHVQLFRCSLQCSNQKWSEKKRSSSSSIICSPPL